MVNKIKMNKILLILIYILNITIVVLMYDYKKLCWKIKPNGKYCKNYNLKNNTKCHLHTKRYVYVKYNLVYKLTLIILMVSLLNFVYIQNINVIRQYIISLYKTDKRIIRNAIILFINYINFIYRTLFSHKYVIK